MKKAIFISVISVVLFSCVQVTGEKGTITDEQVVNYLKAYKKLKEKAPDILRNINENVNGSNAGKMGFNSFESIIKESDIESYAEFVRLNAKIGSVFSILQASRGMNQQQNLQESSQEMFSDGYRFIEEQLNDPDIPEETKAELRITLEELKKGSNELKEEYESNKVIADWVFEKAKKVTGLIVNEADIDVIQAHEEEIFEAYTGFPRPKGFDGNMPDLDTILW
ncbi:MAG: hypothetical protein L3J35_06695 [Bacteroidales bacterium]|nr:hypothetical protein [Bacteroidales bacterium]